jgi:hypothetical protein
LTLRVARFEDAPAHKAGQGGRHFSRSELADDEWLIELGVEPIDGGASRFFDQGRQDAKWGAAFSSSIVSSHEGASADSHTTPMRHRLLIQPAAHQARAPQ